MNSLDFAEILLRDKFSVFRL